VDLPPPDRGELLEALLVELKERNLQATDWYLEKLIQLYEMILVRHGLMLVGPPFGGKSSAFKVRYCDFFLFWMWEFNEYLVDLGWCPDQNFQEP
jgi:Hydrolytic ATP binding site of dynein motor region